MSAAKVHPGGEAGGAKRGLRCRFGFHAFERQEIVHHQHPFYVALSNAICVRCGRQEWWNWPAIHSEGPYV